MIRRVRNIQEDVKIFLGLPPYDDENSITGNQDFYIDCLKTWGEEGFFNALSEVKLKYSLES